MFVLWQMHSSGDEDALIPRPRGSLPKVCAVVLAALTVGGMVFVSPVAICGCIAMVTLILSLGPLLHGLCLLTEEVLHHSNTRWEDSDIEVEYMGGVFALTVLTSPPASVLFLYLPIFCLRYRSTGLLGHVLPACGLGGKTLLAAALAGLLLSLVGHPLPHECHCWMLCLLAPVLYTLLKSLGVLVRFIPDTHTAYQHRQWI